MLELLLSIAVIAAIVFAPQQAIAVILLAMYAELRSIGGKL